MGPKYGPTASSGSGMHSKHTKRVEP